MDLSLVGRQRSSDASSEESSVRERAGYDKAFGSGDESKGFSCSSERETSTQSPNGNVKSYAEGSEEVEDEGEDEVEEGEKKSGSEGDEDDSDEESYEGTSGVPGDNRPFILPEDWVVNKFLPMKSDKVFKELRSCY